MTLTFWQRVYAAIPTGLAASMLTALLCVALFKHMHPTASIFDQHAETKPSGIGTSYYEGYQAGWNAAVKSPPETVITRVGQPAPCGAYRVPGCIDSKPRRRKEPRIVSSGGCAGICGSIDDAKEYANKPFVPRKHKTKTTSAFVDLSRGEGFCDAPGAVGSPSCPEPVNPFTPYEICMLKWSIYSQGNIAPLGNVCPTPPQPKP